jgi:hypothetical protein
LNLAKKVLKAAVPGLRLPGAKRLDNQHADVIDRYLDALPLPNEFCVDIGAADGVTMSNSLRLFSRGWSGLAVECDPAAFRRLKSVHAGRDRVTLCAEKVTPPTVVPLLESHRVPKDFGFLSLDIDGYDHFVLERILAEYRPSLICTEINEKIPPPLKFTVRWDPGYTWRRDHFYGQSIEQAAELAGRHRYSLVELYYNNALFVPEEISPFPALTAAEAYRLGYAGKPDRSTRFPWNADVDHLLQMDPEEAVADLNRRFAGRSGEYELRL